MFGAIRVLGAALIATGLALLPQEVRDAAPVLTHMRLLIAGRLRG